MPGRLSDHLHHLRQRRLGRRKVENQRELPEHLVIPDKLIVFVYQVDAVTGEVGCLDSGRKHLSGVLGDQRIDTAARPAPHDAAQSPDRCLGEADREVRDHEKAIGLGQLSGLHVVGVDGLELVPQVLLDDVLHVVGKVGQPLLDVAVVGPNPPADQVFVVIGEVHEAREILAEPHGIENREMHPPRRQRCQQPKHHGLKRPDRFVATRAVALQQERTSVRKRQHRRRQNR